MYIYVVVACTLGSVSCRRKYIKGLYFSVLLAHFSFLLQYLCMKI